MITIINLLKEENNKISRISLNEINYVVKKINKSKVWSLPVRFSTKLLIVIYRLLVLKLIIF